MSIQRTLAIVKPDGVEQKVLGKVLSRIEEEGFEIAALRLVRLTRSVMRRAAGCRRTSTGSSRPLTVSRS